MPPKGLPPFVCAADEARHSIMLLLANGSEVLDEMNSNESSLQDFKRKLTALMACHARSITTIESLYAHNAFLVGQLVDCQRTIQVLQRHVNAAGDFADSLPSTELGQPDIDRDGNSSSHDNTESA